ncbi:MAG: FGGY family carbohydrate kinase [Actinobacteria bacterium]|nr:FGGY family carbohydrate kinase [Actinomycetota bacterium]
MVKKYFIGIDIGTTYLKAGIYDLNGNLINHYNSILNLYNQKENEYYQDTEEIYLKTIDCIKKCITDKSIESDQIKCISFDGQMGGILAIDKNYNPVINYDLGIDNKAKKYSFLLNKKNFKYIYNKTGCASTYGQKIIYWSNKRNINKKIQKFINIADYVSGRICGIKSDEAFMNFSYLCWSGLCDSEKLNWSKEICNKFNIDMNKLPRIVEAFNIIGHIDKRHAELTGLKEGTPVAAGGGDGSVTLMGAGVNKPGIIAVLLGTAVGTVYSIEGMVKNSKLKLNNLYSIFRDLKFLSSYDLGGLTHSWFTKSFMDNVNIDKSLFELDKKIINIPPCSENLLFLPIFENSILSQNQYRKGAWIGLNPNHKIEHLYKSTLESIAFTRYLEFTNILKACKRDINQEYEIILIGGGAKSDIWSQILSDIFGKRVQRYVRNDFATLGSAFIAAKSIGEIDDISNSIANALIKKPYDYPKMKKHKKYKEFMKIFGFALDKTEEIFTKLNNFNVN